MREGGSNGLAYPSVRNPRGSCIAAFRPKVIGAPVQTRHLQYYWDGTRVARYFDYDSGEWLAI